MNKKKIIITGVSELDKTALARKITCVNDNLTITPHFTTDTEYKNNISDNYIYYMDSNIVNLSYKNNSLLITNTENYITTGVIIDDFYNNDILCVSLVDFNNIIEQCFMNYDILIVWLDTNNKNLITKSDIRETKYLCDKINKGIKHMYFLNESEDTIVNAVTAYIENPDNTELLEIWE